MLLVINQKYIIMIINFEEYTHKLTERECKAVPRVIQGLYNRKGKLYAIHGRKIAAILESEGFGKFSDVRVRKIINFLQVEGIIRNIVANSNGYYIATTQKDLDEYRLSIKQRADAILAKLNGIDYMIQSGES